MLHIGFRATTVISSACYGRDWPSLDGDWTHTGGETVAPEALSPMQSGLSDVRPSELGYLVDGSGIGHYRWHLDDMGTEMKLAD
jgi:hypothetical protein